MPQFSLVTGFFFEGTRENILNIFRALENHLLSVTLFDLPKNHKTSKIISEETVTTNGNTVTDIKIEPVIDMYDNNEDDIKSENKGAFCQEFVWSKSFLGY